MDGWMAGDAGKFWWFLVGLKSNPDPSAHSAPSIRRSVPQKDINQGSKRRCHWVGHDQRHYRDRVVDLVAFHRPVVPVAIEDLSIAAGGPYSPYSPASPCIPAWAASNKRMGEK